MPKQGKKFNEPHPKKDIAIEEDEDESAYIQEN